MAQSTRIDATEALTVRVAEKCGMAPGERRLSDVEVAAIHLLNVAVVKKHNGRGKSVVECQLCGELDYEHRVDCPVPPLEQIMFSDIKDLELKGRSESLAGGN